MFSVLATFMARINRRHLTLGILLAATLACSGCGDSGGGSGDGSSGDPSGGAVPIITNPQTASGKRFPTGFAGEGSTNAVSQLELDALHAGMATAASTAPALGDYLPPGTTFPGTASTSASLLTETGNPLGPQPSSRFTTRTAVNVLSTGLSTVEARLTAIAGTASPSVQWLEFSVPTGMVAQDLRFTTIEAGSAGGSGTYPVPVVELDGPNGSPLFSWKNRELRIDGILLPAQTWSSTGLPLSQLRLYPTAIGSDTSVPYRLAVCGGTGARAVLSLLTVPNPDPSLAGVVGIPLASGDVEISLWWNSRADIDLHLVEPDGTRVYYDALNRTGHTFELTREDNTDGTDGFGPEQMRLIPGALPNGSGSYRIFLHYYAAWPPNAPSGKTHCIVKVKTRTETRLFTRDLSVKGTGAMVADLQFIGAGTARITEASASAALPWQPPQQGQTASKRVATELKQLK